MGLININVLGKNIDFGLLLLHRIARMKQSLVHRSILTMTQNSLLFNRAIGIHHVVLNPIRQMFENIQYCMRTYLILASFG